MFTRAGEQEGSKETEGSTLELRTEGNPYHSQGIGNEPLVGVGEGSGEHRARGMSAGTIPSLPMPTEAALSDASTSQ